MLRRTAALITAVLAASPAAAVTIAPLSFEQLVHASSAVVYGRVSEVRAQWADDRRHIESLVTVEVLEGFKGRSGASIVFIVPGGELGRYANVIPGAPAFTPGDLAVVFLTARGARLPVPTGFTQGIYRVRAGAGAGELVVMPPLVAGDTRIPRGDVRRKPVSLAMFQSSVRAIAESTR